MSFCPVIQAMDLEGLSHIPPEKLQRHRDLVAEQARWQATNKNKKYLDEPMIRHSPFQVKPLKELASEQVAHLFLANKYQEGVLKNQPAVIRELVAKAIINKRKSALFDLFQEKLIPRVAHIRGEGRYLRFRNDGKQLILSACSNLEVWDLTSHPAIPYACLDKGHTQTITAMAFNHSMNQIVSGDSGGSIILWSLQQLPTLSKKIIYLGKIECSDTERQTRSFNVCDWPSVDFLALSPDVKYILSGADSKITLWNAENPAQSQVLLDKLQASATSATFTPHKQCTDLAVKTDDGYSYHFTINDATFQVNRLRTTEFLERLKRYYPAKVEGDKGYTNPAQSQKLLEQWNELNEKHFGPLVSNYDFRTAIAPEGPFVARTAVNERTAWLWNLHELADKFNLEQLKLLAQLKKDNFKQMLADETNQKTFQTFDVPTQQRIIEYYGPDAKQEQTR